MTLVPARPVGKEDCRSAASSRGRLFTCFLLLPDLYHSPHLLSHCREFWRQCRGTSVSCADMRRGCEAQRCCCRQIDAPAWLSLKQLFC